MKKFLLPALCLGALMCSCTDEKKDVPSVEFERQTYVMGSDETITVTAIASKPFENAATVNFATGGSAVKDSDYTLSAESFNFESGASSASVTISPKNNKKDGLNLTLTLEGAADYMVGTTAGTLITIGAKEDIVYSFRDKAAALTTETDIVIRLAGAVSGNEFAAGGELHLPFMIDAASTASESEYEIKGGATEFVFEKGSKTAKITLVSKLSEIPSPAPCVVIKIDESKIPAENKGRFSAGVNDAVTVTFGKALSFSDLEGKWAYSGYPLFYEGADYFIVEMLMEEAGDKKEDLPFHNTESDILEFKTVDDVNMLVPDLKGDLKNYFAECEVNDFEPVKYQWYYVLDSPEWDATKVKLSKVNSLFSAKSQEYKDANVVLYVEGDKLYVVVRDYTPTDFYVGIYNAYDGAIWFPYLEEGYWDQMFEFTKVK